MHVSDFGIIFAIVAGFSFITFIFTQSTLENITREINNSIRGYKEFNDNDDYKRLLNILQTQRTLFTDQNNRIVESLIGSFETDPNKFWQVFSLLVDDEETIKLSGNPDKNFVTIMVYDSDGDNVASYTLNSSQVALFCKALTAWLQTRSDTKQ